MNSNIYRDFRITAEQAIVKDIIRCNWKFDQNKGNIIDSCTCLLTGNLHETIYGAVKEWWDFKGKAEKEKQERWQNADIRWFIFKDLGINRFIDNKTNKILLQTTDNDLIAEFLRDIPKGKTIASQELKNTRHYYTPEGDELLNSIEFQKIVEQKIEEAKQKMLVQPWITNIIVAIQTPYDAYFLDEKNEFWCESRFNDRCKELKETGCDKIWVVNNER